jgi:hypothetical protein
MEGAEIFSLRHSFRTISGSQAAYCQLCIRDQKVRRGYVTTHIYIVTRLRMRGVLPQLPPALLREIYFKLTLHIIIIIIIIIIIKKDNVPISI